MPVLRRCGATGRYASRRTGFGRGRDRRSPRPCAAASSCRSRRPEQREEFAVADVERDVVDGPHRTEGASHPIDRDSRQRGRFPRASRRASARLLDRFLDAPHRLATLGCPASLVVLHELDVGKARHLARELGQVEVLARRTAERVLEDQLTNVLAVNVVDELAGVRRVGPPLMMATPSICAMVPSAGYTTMTGAPFLATDSPRIRARCRGRIRHCPRPGRRARSG